MRLGLSERRGGTAHATGTRLMSRWSWDRGIGDEDWLAHLRASAAALQRQWAVDVDADDGAPSDGGARARQRPRPQLQPVDAAALPVCYPDVDVFAPPQPLLPATTTQRRRRLRPRVDGDGDKTTAPTAADTTVAADTPPSRHPVPVPSAARQLLHPRGPAAAVAGSATPLPSHPAVSASSRPRQHAPSHIPVLAPVLPGGAGRPAVVSLVMEPAAATAAAWQQPWYRRVCSRAYAPHEPAAVARTRRLQLQHQRQLQPRQRRGGEQLAWGDPRAAAAAPAARSSTTARSRSAPRRLAPLAPRPADAADSAAAAVARATAAAALPPALAARVRRLLAPSLPPPPHRRSLPPALRELQAQLLARYAAPEAARGGDGGGGGGSIR